MSAKIYYCICCGDKFTVTPEIEELYEDGEIEKPNMCDECIGIQEGNYEDFIEGTDADNGL